jgi:hypothetical protein
MTRKNTTNWVKGDTTFVRNSPASQLDDTPSLVTPPKALAAGHLARQALTPLLNSSGSLLRYENHVLDWMEVRLTNIADLYLKAKIRHMTSSWVQVRRQLVAAKASAIKLSSALKAMSSKTSYELADQRNFASMYNQGSYNTTVLQRELDDLIARCNSAVAPSAELLQERPYQQVAKGPRPKPHLADAIDRLCRLSPVILGLPYNKNLEQVEPSSQDFVHVGPEFVRIAIQAIDPSLRFATVRTALVNAGQAKVSTK